MDVQPFPFVEKTFLHWGGLCSDSQRSVDYNRTGSISKLSILSQGSICLHFHHYHRVFITVVLQDVSKWIFFHCLGEKKRRRNNTHPKEHRQLTAHLSLEGTEDREAAQEVCRVWTPERGLRGRAFSWGTEPLTGRILHNFNEGNHPCGILWWSGG